MANQDSKSIDTRLGRKILVTSITRIIFPRGVAKKYVDTKFGQHTECSRTHGSQTNRIAVGLRRPVRPVQQPGQTGFLGFGLKRDNYHTYVVKDGEVYEQTSKG